MFTLEPIPGPTPAAGKATADDSPVLHAAIELAEQIAAASDEIEQARRLPLHIAAAMKDAGVFGMAMPRAWGGPELDPLTQFRVIEALAMADGSVGWCAMIGCDGGYVTAFLDQDVARSMYPDPLVATGFAATTTGQAVPVPGGYRVSGRFPFVSGCQHCEWLLLGCIIVEDSVPRVDGNGVPETRQCLLRSSQCEILDTWHTTGLRGTGSNDVAVHDQFVEEAHSFSFQDPELIKRAGPLYAYPFMFMAKGSAPALGIARHAIDALLESAPRKPARRYTVGERLEASKVLIDDTYVQDAVGRAETLLRTTTRSVHHHLSARRRGLCGCSAAGLQGSRRHRGLSEGTTRSLPPRCPDNESARDRDNANLRDGRSSAARSRTAPLAVLRTLHLKE